MVVATYRINSEANHVNIVLTEIKGSVRIELKHPSGINCTESIEQKMRVGNIYVDDIMRSLDIKPNDNGSIHIEVKRTAGVVLLHQRFPLIFDAEAKKATIRIVDMEPL